LNAVEEVPTVPTAPINPQTDPTITYDYDLSSKTQADIQEWLRLKDEEIL